MRLIIRSIVFAAVISAPACAMAFVWPWAQPSLSESHARAIAMDHGFATITDIDGTITGDWRIRGKDPFGRKLELVIDGKTGEVEHAEMNAH